MKIPVTLGVITIWGHQNDSRNLEIGGTPRQRNVHEVEKQSKVERES
jgi:hypothetical protein